MRRPPSWGHFLPSPKEAIHRFYNDRTVIAHLRFEYSCKCVFHGPNPILRMLWSLSLFCKPNNSGPEYPCLERHSHDNSLDKSQQEDPLLLAQIACVRDPRKPKPLQRYQHFCIHQCLAMFHLQEPPWNLCSERISRLSFPVLLGRLFHPHLFRLPRPSQLALGIHHKTPSSYLPERQSDSLPNHTRASHPSCQSSCTCSRQPSLC
mmetsp:Transcript_2817/g.7902  ORF Transcript_2817/g.7902 Transcript_2817/m.7902 type:complete len:206 (+) Transcript_2817:575-1192(+)